MVAGRLAEAAVLAVAVVVADAPRLAAGGRTVAREELRAEAGRDGARE